MYKVKYSYCNMIKKLILFLGLVVFAVSSNAIGFTFSGFFKGQMVNFNSFANPWFAGESLSTIQPLQNGGYNIRPNEQDFARVELIPVIMEQPGLDTYKQCNAILMGVVHKAVDYILAGTSYSCGVYHSGGTYYYAIPHVDFLPGSSGGNANYYYDFGFIKPKKRGQRPTLVYGNADINLKWARVLRIFSGQDDLGGAPINYRPVGSTDHMIYFVLEVSNNPVRAMIADLSQQFNFQDGFVFPFITVESNKELQTPLNINAIHLASYGYSVRGLGDKPRGVSYLKNHDATTLNVIYHTSSVLGNTLNIDNYQPVQAFGDDGGYIADGFWNYSWPKIIGMLNFNDFVLVEKGLARTYVTFDESAPVDKYRLKLQSNYEFFTAPDVADASMELSTIKMNIE